MKYTKLYLIVFNLLFTLSLKGQVKPGFFRNIGVQEGLPSEFVLSTIQDSNGFIWIGTSNGLSRFDGYGFKHYQSDYEDSTAIAGDFIYCMEADDDGKIWIGHYEAGLDLFNPKSGKVEKHFNEFPGPNAIPDNKITRIWLEKSKSRLWIGTSKEHFVWYNKTKNKIEIPVLKKHPDHKTPLPERNSFYDFKPNPLNKDEYWMATNDGLALYNEKTQYIRYYYSKDATGGLTTNNRMRKLHIKGDKIWIVSRGGDGLMCFDMINKTWEVYPSTNQSNNLIVDLFEKTNNELWLATIGSGLMSFDINDKTFNSFNKSDNKSYYLRGLDVRNIFEDKEKNVWVSTTKGLGFYTNYNQFFPLQKITSGTQASLNERTPMCFGDDSSYIYIGLSETKGLVKVDKKNNTQSLITLKGNTENFHIYRIVQRPNGEIWITSSLGILSYKSKEKSLRRQTFINNQLIDNRIHSLYFLNNNSLLIGSRYEGIFECDLTENNFTNLTKENFGLVHDRFIHEIVKDHNGNIWIGTERGISVINFKKKKVIKNFSLSEGYKVIYRLSEDENGIMWASSESQGVFGFSTDKLTRVKTITKKDGLTSNAIQHIAADMVGSLWISTQQGLCKYNLSDSSIQVFNTQNGLIDNHLEGSLNTISDGTIALGFKEHFTIFNPINILQTEKLDKPKITSFEVFDKQRTFDSSSEIVLKPSENFFTIGFSALSYGIADKLDYQYMLVGIDNGWIFAKDKREANYTNLEAGSYEFRVRYNIKGTGEWSEYETQSIEIQPPFTKTIWFYLLLLTLVGGIIRAFYLLKINQVKNEERLKTELNKELLALEMKALRSQMNPHFIFNSLNSIKYYVLQNDTKKASKYLNQFSKLIRRIFNNTQQEFTLLDEEIETIGLFLEMEKLRFGDKLEFEIIVDPNLNTEDIKVPNMLIQPHVENSIWHGIMHKKTTGKIEVIFDKIKDEYLQITIRDNGIGREKASRIKSESANKHKSKGIELTQNRINLINENHGLDITTDFKDLKDEKGFAKGTEVCTKMKIFYVL
ncbi:Two component regulator propeller [Spirosomataceae bacterium TFI 002]|nr:Two component regulator propeller [Spirosomataceae bacterium TFI 002]